MSDEEVIHALQSFEQEYTRLQGGFSIKDKFKNTFSNTKFEALNTAKSIVNSIKAGKFNMNKVLDLFKSIGLWPFFERFTTMFINVSIADALKSDQYKQLFDKSLQSITKFKQSNQAAWSTLMKHLNDLSKYNEAGLYSIALILTTCSDMLTATILSVANIDIFYDKFMATIPEQYKNIINVALQLIIKVASNTLMKSQPQDMQQQQPLEQPVQPITTVSTVQPNNAAKDALFKFINDFIKSHIDVNKMIMSMVGVEGNANVNLYEYISKQPIAKLKQIAMKIDPFGFILPCTAFVMKYISTQVNSIKLKGGYNLSTRTWLASICIILLIGLVVLIIINVTKTTINTSKGAYSNEYVENS